ncbi:MAG: hypothetical protein ACE5MH_04300 [Terriglobia bacterium]
MGTVIRISYWLGVVAGAMALVYRGLLMFQIASGWPDAVGFAPRNLLQLSVLLFLLCLATEVYARNRTAS